MAHAKLKPITREFLKQFYQKYPLAPVPYETRLAHLQRIEALAAEVTKPGSKVPEKVGMPSPTRIDDCFWRNRMICEELAMSLSKMQDGFSGQPELAATCARCHTLLVSAERSIFAVQDDNTASVKAQLQQFIPQDFRGALLERQRVSTEARYKKQIADLVKRGGTIRQKYDMYLQQQWERRQSLVQLGECSGMYKMVIKWVAGIPQVLLDFAKEINAKLGPMEEQRIRYGPDLYGITELGIRLDVCLAAWAEAAGDATPAARAAAPRLAEVVEPAVAFYCEQMLRVIQHIGNVFQHSPFFVNKDDLDTAAESGLGEGQEGQGAAVAPPRPQKQQQGADTECGSSTSASASGDYGAAMAAAVPPPPPAKAPAAPPPPPLAPLPLAPSVTAPPTPGLPLEPPLPRASLLLSAAPSDACPEQQQQHQQQQLLPRFDANGSTNTTTTAPPPPPLHRVSTPTPHTLAAAVVAGYSGRGTPQSCSRVHLSAMSVESHVSYMSAVDHQPWFLLETEEDAATAGAAAAAAREVQQHHRRDQGQQHLCHQLQHHQQQQQQGQLQGQQVQGPQAAGAAVADARGCAGPEGEVGGQPRKEKEWERKREEQGGEEEAVQVVVAGAPGPVARGRGRSSPGGCFGGCFGRSGRQSSGGSQQQQQQEKAAQQRGSRGGGSGSATATAAAAAGSSRSAAGHCTLDRGAEHLRAIAE
ncbi:hypothetical protein PLESTB_001037700 [Pleodorina starrii]|uniref:Uncharacterized protein n=1 Tax=Pleodorina starrii TaxID=330485 RepID=A0A9W6BQE2_9CHLO|nr:hypothetical protein PLESTB_001037700 [Pleodorina starrii]GLC63854.1 hypothetical protein PLESTF_000090400 [Pleodorina starrii]